MVWGLSGNMELAKEGVHCALYLLHAVQNIKWMNNVIEPQPKKNKGWRGLRWRIEAVYNVGI